MPRTPRPVKVVYITDQGFLRPTLVSVWSLLRHLRGPAELHVWGVGLAPQDWRNVERVAAVNPAAELICKDIGAGYLEKAHGPKAYISATTMGRLFIPRLIEGYALYIDGDTLVVGDVSVLFEVDLGENYAGVIRDYSVSHWLADPSAAPGERERRLAEVSRIMQPALASDYFNAGVLLLNCDAIRARPELMTRMEDVVVASACDHGDQDHLNSLFDGRVTHLDLAWNASWGRLRKPRDYLLKAGSPQHGLLPGAPVIVHYHGPNKPWRDWRWDIWSSRGKATLGYRRALRKFVRTFPDLRP
ncbi:MAG: lipopolysaccharide 3-alpha-galactosyltransferase [Cereibacter sp.]|nr:lipopolysaccharide 3-alpha-galactosyltransferase [Cereibacter sp.]